MELLDAFGDVFPIKSGDIPASYISLPEGNHPLPAISWGLGGWLPSYKWSDNKLAPTVDGSEIPFPTTWDVYKPCK